MADTIDSLQIEINAKATTANDAIDRLVGKLDRLTTSLGRINGTNLNGLANGVQRLGTAMQAMNTIKTTDFTRLASNLTKLGDVNVATLNSAASSMSHLTRAFNSMGTVSANAQSVGDMAKNIAKLGNKSVQTAITNIPQLANAMKNLMTTLSKAPSVSKNIIQMTNALANLASQGSKVGTASKSLANGLNNTVLATIRASRVFVNLSSVIGKFYQNYFVVIRGIKKLWSSIENTADYIEAYNYFNVAFGKIASEWSGNFEKYGYENAESYSDSFNKRITESINKLSGINIKINADGTGLLSDSGMKNLGLNIQEITQYASQLASITNSIGQTGEVSLATSKSFTRLAGDISSLFNIDYSTAATNLQSGLIGQSRALYKYGIDITNATLQTYAYTYGIEKNVSEMSQAEKMQLRMLAILDQSKVSWGDLANTINSPSNMLRQFTNNLKETSMVLGQLFIPMLQKVMPIINGAVIAIKRLLGSIADLFGIKLDLSSFGQGYSDIGESIEDISDGLDGVSKSAKKAKAGLRAFDELKTINMPDTSAGGGTSGGGGGIDLTDEIIKATDEYEKVWNEAFAKMENKAQEWADKITKILEPVKKIIKDFAVGDFVQAGQDVSNLVVSITDFFARAIDNVDWQGIGNKIGDFLAGIDWTSILSSVGNLIWQGIKAAFELWAGSFDKAPLETIISTVFAGLSITGISLLPLAKTLVSGLMSQIPTALSELLGAESLGALFEGLSISAPQIAAIVAAVVALTAAIVDAWNTSQLFRDSVINTFNNVKAKVVDAFEKIKEKINPLVESIKELGSSFYDFYVDSHLQDLVAVILSIRAKSLGLEIKIAIDIITAALSFMITQLAGIIDIATGLFKILDGIVTLDFSKIGEGFQTFASGVFEAMTGQTPDEFVESIMSSLKTISGWLNKNVISPISNSFEKLKNRIVEKFTVAKTKVISVWNAVSGWFYDNIIIPIVEKFTWLKNTVSKIFEGLWIIVKAVWIIASNWFKEHVIYPITVKFQELKNNVVTAFTIAKNLVVGVWNTVTTWFNNNVISPIAGKFQELKNNIVNAFTIAKNYVLSIWQNISGWFTTNIANPIINTFNGIVSPIRNAFHNAFSGIRSIATSAINSAISAIESGINKIRLGLNDIIKGFNNIVAKAAKITGQKWNGLDTIGYISLGRVAQYKQGGFPEDGWFRASKGEYFGSFDDGTSYIANNRQIENGIAESVYKGNQENNALMRQEISLLQKQNELLLGILQKDTGISKNDIGIAAQSWARDYSRRTGREAYSF